MLDTIRRKYEMFDKINLVYSWFASGDINEEQLCLVLDEYVRVQAKASLIYDWTSYCECGHFTGLLWSLAHNSRVMKTFKMELLREMLDVHLFDHNLWMRMKRLLGNQSVNTCDQVEFISYPPKGGWGNSLVK